MKKIVRLTEGDLHRIVKESVNKVLTELDWKTYQNAANKAYASGDKRASKFHNQAVTQFNKDYGYDEREFKFLSHTLFNFDKSFEDFSLAIRKRPQLWFKLDGASTLSTS